MNSLYYDKIIYKNNDFVSFCILERVLVFLLGLKYINFGKG